MQLPVEGVLHHSIKEPLVADVARGFATRYYLVESHDGSGVPKVKVLEYDDLRKIPGFKGTSEYTEIILAEYWANNGSDGHTEFQMQGWVLVKETELEWKHPHAGEWPQVEIRRA